MKFLIASDIHGSAFWCRSLLKAFEREGAERLLLLGDILYHGPRNDLPEEYAPKEVAAMLNARREQICGVRGNCDAEIDQMVLQFPMMADYCLLFAGASTVFATHGHVWNKDNLPPLREGDILLHGHTHVPCSEQLPEGVWVLNPGSLSIPKEDSPHAYLLLDDGEFVWKTMDGVAFHRLSFR